MQYNAITTKDGMMQRAEDFSKLSDGGITNDATLLKKFNGWFNEADALIALKLLKSDKRWKFDDSNYSDFPIGFIDLVNNQRDYTLPASTTSGNPSTLFKVNRLRIKYLNGNYYVIDKLDDQEEESTETGIPSKFRLIGNSVRLSPIPTSSFVTLSAGLEVQFGRAPKPYTTSDTTREPAFLSSHHHLIPLYASAQYMMPIDMDLSTKYMQRFEKDLNDLADATANRLDEKPARLIMSQVPFR